MHFVTFQEPNPEDPLNKEAAIELQANRRVFECLKTKSTVEHKVYLGTVGDGAVGFKSHPHLATLKFDGRCGVLQKPFF